MRLIYLILLLIFTIVEVVKHFNMSYISSMLPLASKCPQITRA